MRKIVRNTFTLSLLYGAFGIMVWACAAARPRSTPVEPDARIDPHEKKFFDTVTPWRNPWGTRALRPDASHMGWPWLAYKYPEKVSTVPGIAAPSWHDETMASLEAELIDEINRLRQNPRAYLKHLANFRAMYRGRTVHAPGHLTIQTEEGLVAVDEARAAVRKLEAREPLTRVAALDRAALVHAIDLRQTNRLSHIGHDGSVIAERMGRWGRIRGAFAQMISAGYSDPRLIVLQWLVDDGMILRSNRIHVTAPLFGAVGLACAPHEAYQVVCVATLAGSIKPFEVAPPAAHGAKSKEAT